MPGLNDSHCAEDIYGLLRREFLPIQHVSAWAKTSKLCTLVIRNKGMFFVFQYWDSPTLRWRLCEFSGFHSTCPDANSILSNVPAHQWVLHKIKIDSHHIQFKAEWTYEQVYAGFEILGDSHPESHCWWGLQQKLTFHNVAFMRMGLHIIFVSWRLACNPY